MLQGHLGDELVSDQVQRAAQEGHHPFGTCKKMVQDGDEYRQAETQVLRREHLDSGVHSCNLHCEAGSSAETEASRDDQGTWEEW